jgi:hypothetical protein
MVKVWSGEGGTNKQVSSIIHSFTLIHVMKQVVNRELALPSAPPMLLA